MAAAKIRVSDIAKRMGKSEKDVIFQLQSLGAEITDPSQALEPEVINALITGKKLSTRTKSVIMREDKPQVAAKKETVVRPPRPIIKPPVRAKKETPVEETPAAPPTPSVIIPEFVQAAEAEERAALEAPAPIAERPPRAPEPPAEQPMAAAPAEQPAAPPPAMQPLPSTHIRPTGGTGPRARAPQGPRPNYAGQQPIRSVGAGAPMGGQRPPMSARPPGRAAHRVRWDRADLVRSALVVRGRWVRAVRAPSVRACAVRVVGRDSDLKVRAVQPVLLRRPSPACCRRGARSPPRAKS